MQQDELQVASLEKCRPRNMFDLGIQPIPCSLATMQITEEGKDQESIESNTTPDQSDKNTRKHRIQESQEVSPSPAGDHKAARNRRNTNKKRDAQKKHRLRMVRKKITRWLKHV